MKKRFLSWLVAFCMTFAMLPMHAVAADEAFEIKNGILTKYIGSDGDVTIPDSVISIGDSAFADCDFVTRVVIPDRVTSIGNYAFYGCTSLTDVTIPNKLKSIGDSAFRGCSSIISMNIPDSVTSIGDRAFYGCTFLTGLKLQNNTTNIGEAAFYGCLSLPGITLPNGEVSEKWVTLTAPSADLLPEKNSSKGDFKTFGGDGEFLEAVSAGESGLIPVDISYRNYTSPITRADFCHLVVRLVEVTTKKSATEILNEKELSSTPITFTDTDDDIVSLAVALGIVSGKEDGTFLPDGNITCAEAASMLMRAAKLLGYQESGTAPASQDMSVQPSWANGAVEFVSADDIMNGASSQAFSPNEYCTYTQAYSMVWRLYEALSASNLVLQEKPAGSISNQGKLVLSDGSYITMMNQNGNLKTSLTVDGSVVDEYFSYLTSSDGKIPEKYLNCFLDQTACTAWKSYGDSLYFSSISGLYAYCFTTKRLIRYVDWAVGDFKIYGDKIYLLSNPKNSYIWIAHYNYGQYGCNEIGCVPLSEGKYTRIVDLKPMIESENSKSPQCIDMIEADGSVSFSYVNMSTRGAGNTICYKVLSDGFVQVIGYRGEVVYLYNDVQASIAQTQMEVNKALGQGAVSDYVVMDKTLTKYRGSKTELVIPEDLAINQIKSAFSENKTIQSVALPFGVKQIEGAFVECSNLKSVTLNEGLVSIKDWSFAFCKSLTDINIPNGVTEIGMDAFIYCESLNKIKIPNTVTTIGEEAFRGTALKELNIPDSVTSIGMNAFCECVNLESITIPSSVTYLGKDVFLGANPTIYCYENSLAQKYAVENNLKYVLLQK